MKDMLGPSAVRAIADAGTAASPAFDRRVFLAAATHGLDPLSIMERVRHIADALGAALPRDVPTALAILCDMGPHLTGGFQAVAVSEYAARFGLAHLDTSLDAIAALTRYGTGEFAVRPFLAADPQRTLSVMRRWAGDLDEHVRRLASEGSRPRLPWAARVPALTSDPTLAATILEALKSDPSPYVRKSVANHLNDIAKYKPDWVVERLAGWSQDEATTLWIIRHGLRTLIKAGNPRAMELIGAGVKPLVQAEIFSVAPDTVTLGETIAIEARLVSLSDTAQKLVVDYRIHYVRAGGRSAAKVFKLKTFTLGAHEAASVSMRQAIRDFSTRKHYAGLHRIELLVNGDLAGESQFQILIQQPVGG
ncbi:DNA alkylation repair protein [Ralstonia pseudosolanacearum]|uniref:DNA alkylation repair protein n=1 Tax=Ralstonia pseudosolanacearum TaxID=1310165 RepID=UPI00386FCED4